ncbi:hypothetical protein NL676_037389 [Syzygium grande]|nr:hypothetical protein NL676_037389 [Syzygium grande]
MGTTVVPSSMDVSIPLGDQKGDGFAGRPNPKDLDAGALFVLKSRGPAWGKYFVGPLQFAICYGAVVACTLLGGQSLKFIYLLYKPDGKMQLYQFITMFGGLTLFLAQVPSLSTPSGTSISSLSSSASLTAFAPWAAPFTSVRTHIDKRNSANAPPKDYSVVGSRADRLLGAFNGISIIATTYASGIIPEIQATLAPPVKGKMFKGLCVCYSVIVTTYFSVGISGYWAFGNQSKGTILTNFMGEAQPLLPIWFLLMTNIFCLLQTSAVSVVYLQLTNEVFEKKFADPKMDQFSVRNVVPRLIARSLSVVVATTVATMLPFFGDIMALFGAFGCIPLDFILPMIFYNVAFKPSKRSFVFWVNTTIIVVSSVLVAIGAVASVRQMALDAKTYRLFANM